MRQGGTKTEKAGERANPQGFCLCVRLYKCGCLDGAKQELQKGQSPGEEG